MKNNDDFFVKFWGVRGSIPCPGSETIKYGGNTSSLEIRCGKNILLFDAGTGIKNLGQYLIENKYNVGKIFLSHTHYDHICGLPFFGPAYIPGNKIEIWAGHLDKKYTIKKIIENIMSEPIWPVGIDVFKSDLTFHDFSAGEKLEPYSGVLIKTCSLSHTNGATGYRIEYNGFSICYLTDTDHKPNILDKNILNLIQGADLVIYDSMLTEDEFSQKPHWGHSTWEQGVKLCEAAKVKKFCVFHHDPDHNDSFMDNIAKQVALKKPGSVVATEGMILRPETF